MTFSKDSTVGENAYKKWQYVRSEFCDFVAGLLLPQQLGEAVLAVDEGLRVQVDFEEEKGELLALELEHRLLQLHGAQPLVEVHRPRVGRPPHHPPHARLLQLAVESDELNVLQQRGNGLVVADAAEARVDSRPWNVLGNVNQVEKLVGRLVQLLQQLEVDGLAHLVRSPILAQLIVSHDSEDLPAPDVDLG
jgi:hypothetical protein